jgi:L-phenylalanine/L-methionine N-acetyltransferase
LPLKKMINARHGVMGTNDQNFSLIIRPVEPKDARDINVLRRIPEVAENLLALPSESISQNEEFIAKLTHDDHLFCAEIDQKEKRRVIGLAGLHVHKLPRQRHSAVIGIMVHKDFHGKGIGRALMDKLVDLADNWLLLKRLELTVFPDNERAIDLYKKFGFVVEGTMKYASIRRGTYADFLLMARYNTRLQIP